MRPRTGRFVALAALVFPEAMLEYENYRDYFYSRRVRFFGILAAIFIVDLYDT